MITDLPSRLASLLGILVLGLSSLFLLPKSPERPPPGVSMDLPEFLGEWYGENAMVSQKERDILGAETQFDRRVYTNGRGDQIFVSIVLAGQDMNTSIHRPERCLPAQGYTIIDSGVRKIGLPAHPLSVTRLHNTRSISDMEGHSLTEYSLNYYWFVGCTETTPSHTERNLIDIRDRLFKGYNQPWAYVTVTSRITKGLQSFGRSEQETDAIIVQFLKQLVPVIQKPTVVNS